MDEATYQKQERILRRFIELYCRKNHRGSEGLCGECSDLLAYARERLARCPLDPKPKCKTCKVHCYQPPQRQRIADVMRFSGIHFVKRGRLDWLLRYFLS
ncbi:MAG: nitrous oxide-stimulated promoter family protein [Planctomycetaceae bacterium]|nr:nitrous oxide-stimulated promoter family protein [Planctomycetaceae bacterium]